MRIPSGRNNEAFSNNTPRMLTNLEQGKNVSKIRNSSVRFAHVVLISRHLQYFRSSPLLTFPSFLPLPLLGRDRAKTALDPSKIQLGRELETPSRKNVSFHMKPRGLRTWEWSKKKKNVTRCCSRLMFAECRSTLDDHRHEIRDSFADIHGSLTQVMIDEAERERGKWALYPLRTSVP